MTIQIEENLFQIPRHCKIKERQKKKDRNCKVRHSLMSHAPLHHTSCATHENDQGVLVAWFLSCF